MAGFPHAVMRALLQGVLADAGLADRIGGGERIYWSQVPQGSPNPALRFMVINDDPLAALAGATGTRQADLQIDVYAADQDACAALANPLAAALEWRRGPAPWSLWEPQGRTDPEFEDATRVYAARLEYLVSYVAG